MRVELVWEHTVLDACAYYAIINEFTIHSQWMPSQIPYTGLMMTPSYHWPREPVASIAIATDTSTVDMHNAQLPWIHIISTQDIRCKTYGRNPRTARDCIHGLAYSLQISDEPEQQVYASYGSQAYSDTVYDYRRKLRCTIGQHLACVLYEQNKYWASQWSPSQCCLEDARELVASVQQQCSQLFELHERVIACGTSSYIYFVRIRTCGPTHHLQQNR